MFRAPHDAFGRLRYSFDVGSRVKIFRDFWGRGDND